MLELINFDVLDVDAWIDPEGGWTYNAAYNIGRFKTRGNEKRAFIRYLNKRGIYFKKGRTLLDVQDGGNVIEIQDRKTKQPLFAAVYHETNDTTNK